MISPYLGRPTRTLEEACEELHRNHGGEAWACADCEYREICPRAGKVGNVVSLRRLRPSTACRAMRGVTQSDD